MSRDNDEKRNTIKGQFPDKDKIICKDCIFRDKTIVNINNKEIPVGVTKLFCEMFKEPPKSNGKPHEILFNNEECVLYIKEMEKQKEFENRIKSEQQCGGPIKNKDLVCKDCDYVFDDTERFGNVSVCMRYESKPTRVLLGGKCDLYEKSSI